MGENPIVWAKNLRGLVNDEMRADNKDSPLFCSERIAITETARVQESAAVESFKAGGYKEYVWIAETDERTCPTCAALDNQIFSTDEVEFGISLPPLHPFCRCSVAAYVAEPLK